MKNSQNNKLLYSADQRPPRGPLFFSSLQHMLLVLSLGMAMPIAVARSAGLDLTQSGSLLAAALFAMGVTGLLQTYPGKWVGSGFQSLSVSDSAALAACVMAAEIGGVPLVLGMTIFSGVVKTILGFFTFNFRKMFPPEVTGTMIFILGVNTLPAGLKYFLGPQTGGEYNYVYLLVSVVTLVFMLSCTLFIKPLKPYSALAGILFGFVFSMVVGVFDPTSLAALGSQPFVALPVYSDLAFSFDFKVLAPFVIITIAAVVDNIGDYSSSQSANDPNYQKPNWRSIEGGIRGSGLGSIFSGLIGGPMQSTATTNIGIARASRITSRMVAYVACGMLMIVSFFPQLTGAISMIPGPVLGAVLMYSICYIMAGGFSALSSRELDDRRIFVIFLSIGFSISTLMPGMYSFLPKNVAQILVSPMVMGVGVLLVTTFLARIGTKRRFKFVCGVKREDVVVLNQKIESVCREWATDRQLAMRLGIALSAMCEGFYEENPETKLEFEIYYDQLEVKLDILPVGCRIPSDIGTEESFDTTLGIALMMVRNMFDTVRIVQKGDKHLIHMDADM